MELGTTRDLAPACRGSARGVASGSRSRGCVGSLLGTRVRDRSDTCSLQRWRVAARCELRYPSAHERTNRGARSQCALAARYLCARSRHPLASTVVTQRLASSAWREAARARGAAACCVPILFLFDRDSSFAGVFDVYSAAQHFQEISREGQS